MGSSFEFTPLAIPHLALGLMVLAVGVITVVIRGSAIIRVSVLLVCLTAFPYPAGMATNMLSTDPAVAHIGSKALVGSMALVGPALMMLFLAISGRLERYRWLVLLGFVVSSGFATLAWATDLAIAPEPYVTPLGFYYHVARAWDGPVVGQLAIWSLLGLYLAQRAGGAARSERQRQLARRFVLVGVLAVSGLTDALLSHGIGFYPFGVVPGTGAVLLMLVAVLKYDLLRSRGFDRAGAIELIMLIFSVVAVLVILWSMHSMEVELSPWSIVALVAPVALLGQAAMLLVRRHFAEQVAEPVVNTDLETYVEHTGRITHEHELLEPLAELLAEHGGLPNVTLLLTGEDERLRPLGEPGAEGIEVDARMRPWFIASPTLLVLDELPTMRLGGLRLPVEAFMAALGMPVAMPLVDREQLVGFLCGTPTGHRALREDEASVLVESATATAKAVTYASLLREATDRIEVAKEVEVASAVQQARTAGEQRLRYADCEVVGYYQPAPHFGGHWWSSHEMADGRFLVVIGDVTGSGVPAALVSFTAEGACETAQRMYGASLEVISLLESLDASLRHVGAEYTMACFAAIFDPSARRVTFANAGHPFPYVCRAGGAKTELRSLVSRGTMLGSGELVVSARTFDLDADDLIVFYSDSLVTGTSPEGKVYGDRRLQRVLRNKAARAGEQATQVILNDATDFWGRPDPGDDLNVVVVRMGAYG